MRCRCVVGQVDNVMLGDTEENGKLDKEAKAPR